MKTPETKSSCDSTRVVIEDEWALSLRSAVARPWGKPKTSQRLVCDVPDSELEVCYAESARCAFCAGEFLRQEHVAKGCGDASHRAHVECWALIRHKLPDVRCPGALLSSCEPRIVELSMVEISKIRVSAEQRLRELMRRESGKDVSNLSRASQVRHMKMNQHFQRVVHAITDDALWSSFVGSSRTTRCRAVMGDMEEKRTCCVCGSCVCSMDSLATCRRHHAHETCWAFFRELHDRCGIRIQTECPAQYFRFPDCAGAISLKNE